MTNKATTAAAIKALFSHYLCVDAADINQNVLVHALRLDLVDVFPFVNQDEVSRVSVELTRKGDKLLNR
jgi:hypothetical protein